MNDLTILLRDDQRHFRPGETVEGIAQWRADEAPVSVELRLFWSTRGKGTEDVGLVGEQIFAAPQRAEGRPFQFQLPNGPYSFSGHLMSLLWTLELVINPGHQAVRTELILAPRGEEILLFTDAGA